MIIEDKSGYSCMGGMGDLIIQTVKKAHESLDVSRNGE